MRWGLWNRPRPPPSILCVSNVASSTGLGKTTCTITRMKWMTIWSAISAFSLCCSHWTPPADIPSAASASETSYRRRISVRWTGRDSTLSHVRSLAFWFINSWTNCWFRVHFPQCAMTWCSAVTWKAILRTGEQEKGERGSRLCGKAAQADRSRKHEYKTYRQKVSFYTYQYFFF